jgi:hypothetical protein
MRLVLDITITPDGHYHGHVARAGIAAGQEFTGILELLAILEQLLLPNRADGGTDPNADK